MIESIMAKGFIAISAYMYVFALLALILFIVAIIANAFFKSNRFNRGNPKTLSNKPVLYDGVRSSGLLPRLKKGRKYDL